MTLREKLEASAKSYYTAKAKLTASRARQEAIAKRLQESETNLVRLTAKVGEIAAARYKGSEISVVTSILVGEGSAEEMLRGAAVADYLVWRDDEQLRKYRETRDDSKRQKQLLEKEVATQAQQLAALDKQKRDAEKALASVGGLVSAGYTGPPPKAQPAPRRSDGGWPGESCSVKDPTGTGGCITPRTYHAVTEARLAGFTRFTKCWRTQSWGEHPRGRACDFSSARNGFAGAATGGDRTYGNRLAAWCKSNAEALGVMYVIWYRQIWMPGVGWRSYSGSGGASGEHTNHVHLSML